MFTDRWWLAKAAVALGLFSALCHLSSNLLDALHPDIERAALFTDEIRDKDFVLWGKQVVSSDAEGFVIMSRVGPMRFLTPAAPRVGEWVSLIARPVGPRTLRVSSIQINAGWEWKRPLNYALSVLLVIVYLAWNRRLFRWDGAEGVLKGKY